MLSILTFIALGVVGCKGQTNKIFQWQFQDQAISTQLGTCVKYPIVVKPFNATGNNGVPPYFMISFAIGGIPVTTPIGSDPNNLLWTLTQPAGSDLLLSVVDSSQGAGGIPPQLFSVIPGQTTQCVSTPDEPDPPFEIKSNVTGNLETCQPWGITVSGGVPPYTITLAETNQPVVTNVTMALDADRFTYPNRGVPGGSLIAAVSDFEGRWAKGTQVVHTVGSNDETCTGLVSSSGNATLIDAQDAALNAQLSASKHRKSIVTGVAVTLVLLLAMGCGVMWYLRYRRRAEIRQKRVSEQRARQFSTTDIPQNWETFDSIVRPFEVDSRAPVYEKRNGNPLPRAVSEPELQAPPYQEVESSSISFGRATAGWATFNSVEPSLPSFPRNDGPSQKSAQIKRLDIPKPRPPPSISTSPSSSQQGTGTSSASTTTSEIVSAFPDAPISTPVVISPIIPRTGRKASAGFVTFPRNSVRGSAPGSGSPAQEERSRSANGGPATNSPGTQQAGREEMTQSISRVVETIAEEGTQLPRYRSGAQ